MSSSNTDLSQDADTSANIDVDVDAGVGVLVVDLSSLTFRWSNSGGLLTVVTSRDEVLAVFDTTQLRSEAGGAAASAVVSADLAGRTKVAGGTPQDAVGGVDREWLAREAAYQALEQAAATARVLRDGNELRVAFYNPYTAQVSFGAAPDTQVFRAAEPLALPAAGAVGVVSAAGEDVEGRRLLVECVDGPTVVPPRPTFTVTELTRVLAAHRDT